MAGRKSPAYDPERLGGLTPAELGYIAGIIDGEGYIGANFTMVQDKAPYARVRLTVANTSLPLIEWLRDKCGGWINNLNSTEYRKAHPHHKPAWQWQLSAGGASALLRLVREYLVIKRDRADIAIRLAELAEESRALGRKNGVPETITKERIVLIDELRRLNKKGVA